MPAVATEVRWSRTLDGLGEHGPGPLVDPPIHVFIADRFLEDGEQLELPDGTPVIVVSLTVLHRGRTTTQQVSVRPFAV